MNTFIDKKSILNKTELFVKKQLKNDYSGHDIDHIIRVVKNAKDICKEIPKANTFIVEMAALLHDIADHKLLGDKGEKLIKKYLDLLNIPNNEKNEIFNIATQVSFKGANVEDSKLSIEGQIVRDADRLDAIGAIGIARTFAFGGAKKRKMYNEKESPVFHNSFEEYKNNKGTTINHFYEKLLLLKDKMYTLPGKEMAKKRHQFMIAFLNQFYDETGYKTPKMKTDL